MSVVEDAVAALVSNGKDQRTPLETLRTATHRLAGSGATFGFSEISTHAKKIELVCDAHLERGQPLSDSECSELSSMVDDLMSVSLHGPDEAPDGGQEAGPLQQISRHDSDQRIFVVEDDVLFAETDFKGIEKLWLQGRRVSIIPMI